MMAKADLWESKSSIFDTDELFLKQIDFEYLSQLLNIIADDELLFKKYGEEHFSRLKNQKTTLLRIRYKIDYLLQNNLIPLPAKKPKIESVAKTAKAPTKNTIRKTKKHDILATNSNSYSRIV